MEDFTEDPDPINYDYEIMQRKMLTKHLHLPKEPMKAHINDRFTWGEAFTLEDAFSYSKYEFLARVKTLLLRKRCWHKLAYLRDMEKHWKHTIACVRTWDTRI
jgi:hypothetical protein